MDLLLNQHISPYSLLEPVGKVCLSYPLNQRLVKKPASWKFYESNVSSTYKVGIPKDTFIKNVCGISSEGLFILPTSSPEWLFLKGIDRMVWNIFGEGTVGFSQNVNNLKTKPFEAEIPNLILPPNF